MDGVQGVMKEDKLKAIDIRFFLVPLTILILLFAVISYKSVNDYIRTTYKMMEEHSLDIAESYARRLLNSEIASNIISDFIKEKLVWAVEAVKTLDIKSDNESLLEVSKKCFVDEINIFDETGEIVNSSTEKMIGLKVGSEHRIHEVIRGNQEFLIEDITPNIKTGVVYKYAYSKHKSNLFIQVGILADKIDDFLHRFEIE